MKSNVLFRYFILTVLSTTALIVIPLAVCGLSLALTVPILLKLHRRCRVDEITPEWLESFSPSVYYPMAGLLADEDFRFLSRQPGFDLSLYRKLRRERLVIFHQYLSRLILDFNRLHAIARALLARAQEDQSDLLTKLMWLKVKFSVAVIEAEFSYLCCCIGFRFLTARAVILRLEEMSSQLTQISAAQAA